MVAELATAEHKVERYVAGLSGKLHPKSQDIGISVRRCKILDIEQP